jgi:hypothetical protein
MGSLVKSGFYVDIKVRIENDRKRFLTSPIPIWSTDRKSFTQGSISTASASAS